MPGISSQIFCNLLAVSADGRKKGGNFINEQYKKMVPIPVSLKK